MTGYSQIDSLKKEYQKEFDDFSRTIQQDSDAFSRKNDSIFLEFLLQSWETFDAFKSEAPMRPKPKEQPVKEKSDMHMHPIKPGDIRTPAEELRIEQGKRESTDAASPAKGYTAAPSLALDFYGSEVMIIPPREKLPRLRQVSPMYFVEFFEEAARSDVFSENVRLLQHQAKELDLNDWGLICLLKSAAESIFQDYNDQVLFIWFGMIRCGFDVRTGYDKNTVYLLAPSSQVLYNTVYFVINKKKYFLLKIGNKEADIANLNAYEADYPGNTLPISLIVHALPKLSENKIVRNIFYHKEFAINTDQHLVDYFSGFPECDLVVSLTAPLSFLSRASFKIEIEPMIEGKNDYQKVEYLLKLMQYGFPYKTDEEQFGRENYLFAEEVLFYPYSDCEDRTALLARLVELFTGLETIAICYPDHVTLGVRFSVKQNGAYVEYKGNQYYICDPTYIGAEIGMLMPDYQGVNPDIIDL
ncbi:MAG: hypothetical protein K0B08_04290 [Bacteroidales bacterium]|nr:hypothetical protein [Bacteroidales bacterium]